jgi:hypothetical protein
MPGRYWLLKTLRVEHEIAHSDLTVLPKKKMRPYEDLPQKTETIRRSRDYGKGAVITPKELLPYHGHQAGGKLQPKPANALDFENYEGGSRKHSLRPHCAAARKVG